MQNLYDIHELTSDTVQTFQSLFHLLCDILSIALLHILRSAGKQPAVSPIAASSRTDHIILQFVNFLSGDIRHTTAQEMEYGIIRKISDI